MLGRWGARLRRRTRGAVDTGPRQSARSRGAEDKAHLTEFARTRRGVEAFVEPPTAVTPTTAVLVAHDGEWTRREVPSAKALHELANSLGIPSYDAAVVGYPRRMREWNTRAAAEQRRAREG